MDQRTLVSESESSAGSSCSPNSASKGDCTKVGAGGISAAEELAKMKSYSSVCILSSFEITLDRRISTQALTRSDV
jgi:hypothetical protein